MKKIILIAMLSIVSICFSQEKKISKSGIITFEASVPSFEEVKATNNSVTFVLNTATGEIASLALIKEFHFKVGLMEEHFNENYMESDQFSKALFKGKIDGFDPNNLTVTPKFYTIRGSLELHGKSKEINVIAKINKTSLVIKIVSNFTINASDYSISIPNIVKNKLSNKVNAQIVAVFKYKDIKE